MSFVDAIDKEIATLEEKLRELRRVRDLYNEGAPKVQPPTAGFGSTGERPGRKPSPDRMRAISEIRQFLLGRATPTKTKDILSHIEGLGIVIGGASPQNNLSAMLYNAAEFQSHGKAGWTLVSVEQSTGKPPVGITGDHQPE